MNFDLKKATPGPSPLEARETVPLQAMLHRDERGSGKGQLEEAMGQLTARLEGFIYSFQAGKRRTTLSQSKISISTLE
jgi:hypothetical protein